MRVSESLFLLVEVRVVNNRRKALLLFYGKPDEQSDKEKSDACHADDRTGNLNRGDFFLVDPR